MLSLNQTAAFFLTSAAKPLLQRASAPAVVNVSSLAGIRSSGTGVVYAMTKARAGLADLSANI
jgi:Tropinone reductase 1